MNKVQVLLKKHSSTILTVAGAAGVVATTVLAVKATPKALELIDDEIRRQNQELFAADVDNELTDYARIVKLKPIEVVKVAWKPYIPAVITGVSTIACIFGANILNKRQQAALISAYAVLDRSYQEYREYVKNQNEEHSDIHIIKEIAKTRIDDSVVLDEDKELFFDFESMQMFQSTFDELERAENIINQQIALSGFACLNDLYELLNLPLVDYGNNVGWSTITNDRLYGHECLKFEYEKAEMEDGMECWIVTMNCLPSAEYIR